MYALLLLQANTFQAVIATDGLETFVLFIYADIEWGDGATVGFNAGDGNRSIVVTTQPLDLETGSNVGVTGLYINRVDLFDPTDGEKIKHITLHVTKNLLGMSTYQHCISKSFVLSDYSDVQFFLPSYHWVQPNNLLCV